MHDFRSWKSRNGMNSRNGRKSSNGSRNGRINMNPRNVKNVRYRRKPWGITAPSSASAISTVNISANITNPKQKLIKSIKVFHKVWGITYEP